MPRAPNTSPKSGVAAFAGDDGLLAAVVRVLDEDGFKVVGAHDILADVLGPAGPLGATAAPVEAMADVARGIAVLKTIGAADIGQACVVQQGIVLAVEAVEGTDAMPEPGRRTGPAGPRRRVGETCQAGAGAPRRPAHHRRDHDPAGA